MSPQVKIYLLGVRNDRIVVADRFFFYYIISVNILIPGDISVGAMREICMADTEVGELNLVPRFTCHSFTVCTFCGQLLEIDAVHLIHIE